MDYLKVFYIPKTKGRNTFCLSQKINFCCFLIKYFRQKSDVFVLNRNCVTKWIWCVLQNWSYLGLYYTMKKYYFSAFVSVLDWLGEGPRGGSKIVNNSVTSFIFFTKHINLWRILSKLCLMSQKRNFFIFFSISFKCTRMAFVLALLFASEQINVYKQGFHYGQKFEKLCI